MTDGRNRTGTIGARSARRPLVCGCALALLGGVIAGPAWADALYDMAFEARYDAVGDPTALDNFTREAVRVGQYDQAISSLETVLFNDPNNLDARLALARLYYHVGAFELALGHIDEGLALAAGLVDFERALRDLQKRIERVQQPVRAIVDLTVGGEYTHVDETVTTGGSFQGGGLGGFAAIDAGLVFDLDNASRDAIVVAGGVEIDQPFIDTDLDETYDIFTATNAYAEVTLSKGLPDIIDTLRVDLTGYWEREELGQVPNTIESLIWTREEIGVRGRISVRPSVETLFYIDGRYGWFDDTDNAYIADRRWSVGAGVQARLAPGWTAHGRVSRIVTSGDADGSVPLPFPGQALPEYDVSATALEASLKHLLYVFDDGRAWFQEWSAGYVDGEIFDVGAYACCGPTPRFADRQAWHVNWDHSVQIGTNGRIFAGVGYRQENVEGPFQTRNTDHVTGRLGYTIRFE